MFPSKVDDQRGTVSLRSLSEETTGTLINGRSDTPHMLLLPTLPFDLVPEILCRLPVKLLLQLRCVCKSWKSLISDPIFTKKHLRMSKTSQHHHHVIVSTHSNHLFLWDFPIHSLFSAAVSNSRVTHTQLKCPEILNNVQGADMRVCSCEGILCFTSIRERLPPLLWNPSTRKFSVVPPLGNSRKIVHRTLYSFGYDHVTHTYNIVSVSSFGDKNNEVNVYTLGSHLWRTIENLEFSGAISKPGVFSNGTINWLTYDALSSSLHVIVSLDLEKESYQKLVLPNVGDGRLTLGVLKDCLCIFATDDTSADVWIMKGNENKKPWTKLYSVPYKREWGFYPYANALYITQDGQLLMYFQDMINLKLAIHDSKNGTLNMPEFQSVGSWMDPEVYIESLISPCS